MRRARQREAWYHTAHLLAIVAEVHRDPDRRPQPFTADDFPLPEPGQKPMRPRRPPPPTEAQMLALNQLYPGPGGPREKGE